ncbi:hypothetical protein ACFVAJ_05355 [Agromyces sp. NPDC057679]|uniref:hypothetical protein n=1 Tax=Agromyces sp. NPDC057679 TaxID=3346207 RepID=UPI0036718D3C
MAIGLVGIAALASATWLAVLSFGAAEPTGASRPNLGAALVDAVPANPGAGAELVASFTTHWSTGGGDAMVYVYDNGLVLSSGPWNERRLTPHGVELLRAGIVASGILDPDRHAEASESGSGAFLQLRVGGTLTTAWQPRGRDGDAEVAEFDRVVIQLRDFDDWLPADAWAQRPTTPYVPPGYAICSSGDEEGDPPHVHDAVLPLLPRNASAILAAGPRYTSIDPRTDAYAASPSSPSYDILGCRQVTPAQAQSVVDALVRAGWGVEDSGPPPEGERVLLAVRERLDPFTMSTEFPDFGTVNVEFLPILPHGVPECACTG